MSVASFQGSIAGKYDAELGPIIFTPYAKDMVGRLALTGPVKVLELAAGTGRLTTELQAVLPAGSSLTATDISDEMLAVAKAAAAHNDSVTLTHAPANMEDLATFADASFDIVIAQFGFMLVADYAMAFAEARRVLVPGGRLLFSVWSQEEQSPMFALAYQVVSVYAKDKDEATQAKFAAIGKAAYRLSDAAAVASHLATAGFSTSTVTKVPITVTDTATLARGMVTGTPYTTLVPSDEHATCMTQMQASLGATCLMEAHVHEATA